MINYITLVILSLLTLLILGSVFILIRLLKNQTLLTYDSDPFLVPQPYQKFLQANNLLHDEESELHTISMGEESKFKVHDIKMNEPILAVENVGRGPAKKISLEICPDDNFHNFNTVQEEIFVDLGANRIISIVKNPEYKKKISFEKDFFIKIRYSAAYGKNSFEALYQAHVVEIQGRNRLIFFIPTFKRVY